MTFINTRPVALPAFLAVAALFLAGCQGAVSVDLTADAPADPRIAGVNVDVAGVEFERTDGTTEKLEFTTSTRTDLITFLEGNGMQMFTDEQLSEGSYTGVRLLLEDNGNATLVAIDGTEFPLRLAAGAYTKVDFTVVKDESSRENLGLTIDLRKSLTFNEADNDYTLTPVLRSARLDEAGHLTANVDVTCPVGTSLLQGGAAYLFEGQDIEPDDIDGAGVEPYATAAVISSLGGPSSYTLRLLPAGDYTIAITCNGNIDSPAQDDDVRFQQTANVTIEADTTNTGNNNGGGPY